MENIADLLKDAFSEVEIDFEHLQFDKDTNTSQTQLVMDENLKDIRKLWATSVQGSNKTFTDVHKQEENADSSDSSEESALHNLPDIKTGIDYEQVFKKPITETQQLNQTYEEHTVEEQSRRCDSEAGVLADVNTETEATFREEETDGLEISSAEYQPLMEKTSPHSMSSGIQMMQNRSSVSEEEEPDDASSEDQMPHCKSDGNKDELFAAGCHVRYDLREFTEDDQEQVEESLADYPSDLSQSETETCAENGRDQMWIPSDSILCDDHSAHGIKDSFRTAKGNFEEEDRKMDFSVTSCNAEINQLDIDPISDTADKNVPLQRTNANEDNLQGTLTKDCTTAEDTREKEDSGDESDVNDQPGYDSDISNDDNSTCQEETSFVSSEKKKEEWESVTQHSNFMEDMERVDYNINYIETHKDDTDGSHPEKPIQSAERLFLSASLSEAEERTPTSKTPVSYAQFCHKESNEQCTELHPKPEIAQLTSAIKEQGQPEVIDRASQRFSEVTDSIRANTLIPEEFLSSILRMDDGNLCLDEFNWTLTEGELPEDHLGEADNQEDIEEIQGETDSSEDGEENERDWEKEKTRIEAFYRFYGDQVETQEEVGRNHKVTFCLDHELSEYEDDSESSEQEEDEEPHSPVTTVKSEYHSESDEPQEKFFHPEKPKIRPKEQQHVSPALQTRPQRNRCLAVLTSALALGLMTAIGVVSFWWTTDSLDWTH